mmetsp:Transcript_4051/g.11878  ORF Transcript_4051/g.11878 Transcript_4051/m.11878 type:complete len:596 (-) Transcript_4051:640-2427(-)
MAGMEGKRESWRRKSFTKAMQMINPRDLEEDEDHDFTDLADTVQGRTRSRSSPRTDPADEGYSKGEGNGHAHQPPVRRRSLASHHDLSVTSSRSAKSPPPGSHSPPRSNFQSMLRRMSHTNLHYQNGESNGKSQEDERLLQELLDRADQEDGRTTVSMAELRALREHMTRKERPTSISRLHERRASMASMRSSNDPESPSGHGNGWHPQRRPSRVMERRPSLQAVAGSVIQSGRVAKGLQERVRRRTSMAPTAAAAVVAPPRNGVDVHADEILTSLRTWNFNVFDAMSMIPREAYLFLGLAIFEDSHLEEIFELENEKLCKFLLKVEHGYSEKQPYHNKMHSLDVCQTMHYMLHVAGLGEAVSDLARLAGIISALIHDVGHFGLNNGYLMQTNHDLALTYAYQSPLERMHLYKALSILSREDSNILCKMAPENVNLCRSLIVDCVLGTDMAFHKADCTRLEGLVATEVDMTDSETSKFILRAALHAADISNPAKEWKYYNQWTDRIIEEFHAQGDKERQRGMPISMGCDRDKMRTIKDKANGQLFFLGMLVRPLYETLNKLLFIQLEAPLANLDINLKNWKTAVEEFDTKQKHSV